ncbi:MAG: FTR1 family protein [Tepidisphaeraceae bacterium]|jgi:high-affinity iron transporter
MLSDSQPVGRTIIPLIQLGEATEAAKRRGKWALHGAVAAGIVIIAGILIWQAITAHGAPDPTVDGVRPVAAVVDTGILVFREGLEAILVLAALTASLVRTEEGYWKPVALGAGISLVACFGTWFAVVALISFMNFPQLDIQAATGLLAIGVLLVIMNWFFHKVYWTGWITFQNRWKRNLVDNPARSRTAIFRGLALIGFTSVYREGFELVVFLQSVRLKWGSHVVLEGVLIGLALVSIVAMLTFVLHYRLPYKRMLVLTGIMLGIVLIVMVGENIQEMQPDGGSNWIRAVPLAIHMPDWLNTWFAVYPDAISLSAQALAAAFVIGSYFLARRVCAHKGDETLAANGACIVPDCNNCSIPHTDGVGSEINSGCK